MAILFLEGFEGYGTSDGGAVNSSFQRRWSVPTDFHLMDVEPSQYNAGDSGKSLQWPTSFDRACLSEDLGANTTLYVGFGWKPGNMSDKIFFRFREPSDGAGMNLRFNTQGRIQVYRAGTWMADVKGYQVMHNQWQYIEFKVTINNTTGSFEVRINGKSYLTQSSVDTQNGGTAELRKVELYGSNGQGFWDNLYVDDATFHGPCRVNSLLPNGDDTTNWTPDSGTTNYTQVDENPPDDDTSYVDSSASVIQDTYDYGNLTNLDTIKSVQISTDVKVTDATTYTLENLIKSGGTIYGETGVLVSSTSYVWHNRIADTDPNTASAWTNTNVDAAKFGIENQ